MEERLAGWYRSVGEILHEGHLAEPTALVDMINHAVRPLGVRVAIFLVDREQLAMRSLPREGEAPGEPLPIDSTVAGRAFMTVQPVAPPGTDGLVWVPMVDGSDRLGVVEVRLPDGTKADDLATATGIDLVVSAISYLVVAKASYGDVIRRTRRSRPMSTEGELLWRALPPLTFATRDLSLAAVLEPSYRVGGDAFDYAIDHGVLRVGIFDAVGHGLRAAQTSTLTLAATRAARAAGADLAGIADAADAALAEQLTEGAYTTAILAELHRDTGKVRYVNAGHPPAVVMRDGKVVAALEAEPRTPLGVASASRVSEYHLEPGDRLLFYTDGITEGRDAAGEFFGQDRLVDLAERNSTGGLPAAETLRRIAFAVLDHQAGELHDDATLMMVEWLPSPATPI